MSVKVFCKEHDLMETFETMREAEEFVLEKHPYCDTEFKEPKK